MKLQRGLIVCERRGDWAVALRRALLAVAGDEVRLIETRSPQECRELLHEFSAAVVAVELTAHNVGPVTELLATLDRRGPGFVGLVMLAAGLELNEFVVRECGAVHVVYSLIEAADIVAVARRHLAQIAEPSGVDPSISLAEEMRQRLPWGE